jgi:hypothetical protein
MADNNYHSKIVSHIFTENKINALKMKTKFVSVTDTILQNSERYAPESKAITSRKINLNVNTTELQTVLQNNLE